MESNEQYKSLVDMGCSAVLSEAAIRTLKSQDLSALLDWISDHSEEEDKWQKWLEDQKNAPSEEKPEAGLTQSIDHLVKKELSEELQKKGHSKNVSQKALLFSGTVSLMQATSVSELQKTGLKSISTILTSKRKPSSRGRWRTSPNLPLRRPS
jgi:predicted HicB family RNase H-like nuclease